MAGSFRGDTVEKKSERRSNRQPWWSRQALGYEAGTVAVVDFLGRFADVMEIDSTWLRQQVDEAVFAGGTDGQHVFLRVDRARLERFVDRMELAVERADLLAKLAASGQRRRDRRRAGQERDKSGTEAEQTECSERRTEADDQLEQATAMKS